MNEQLLGVISSLYIRYGGKRGGYALAVTSNRVVGAPLKAVTSSFVEYLGERSKATPEQHEKGQQLLEEILANKNLEITKDSIRRISFTDVGIFSGAEFLFKTNHGDYLIETAPMKVSVGVDLPLKGMMGSLIVFAPDKFYNEKTGALVMKEQLAKLQARKKQ